MKRTAAVATVLLAGLIFGQGVNVGLSTEGGKMKDTFEVINSRKSVRHFTGKAVDKADLDKIVRAGMAAPTAVNMQPWSFVVVTNRAVMDKLGEALPHAQMIAKAGAIIVVCTEPAKAINASQDFAIIDASLAGENILLATEALGLGATWTAAYPDKEAMQSVRDILGIPGSVIPLNVTPIGYPTGEDKPKDKYKKEKLHWEKW